MAFARLAVADKESRIQSKRYHFGLKQAGSNFGTSSLYAQIDFNHSFVVPSFENRNICSTRSAKPTYTRILKFEPVAENPRCGAPNHFYLLVLIMITLT